MSPKDGQMPLPPRPLTKRERKERARKLLPRCQATDGTHVCERELGHGNGWVGNKHQQGGFMWTDAGANRIIAEPFVVLHPKSVYFIRGQVTGLIKIGKANNVSRRFCALQSASPDTLILVASITFEDGRKATDKEIQLHQWFAEFRHHGEWFHPNEELNKLIESLVPKY